MQRYYSLMKATTNWPYSIPSFKLYSHPRSRHLHHSTIPIPPTTPNLYRKKYLPFPIINNPPPLPLPPTPLAHTLAEGRAAAAGQRRIKRAVTSTVYAGRRRLAVIRGVGVVSRGRGSLFPSMMSLGVSQDVLGRGGVAERGPRGLLVVREEVRPGRGRPGASPRHHSRDVHHQAGAVVEENGDPELDAVGIGHNAPLASLPLLFSLFFLPLLPPLSNHAEDGGRGMAQGPRHSPEAALRGGTPFRRRRESHAARHHSGRPS